MGYTRDSKESFLGLTRRILWDSFCLCAFIYVISLYITNSAYAQIDTRAIAQIESSNNASAVGDGGKALGLFQLHPNAVKDANRYLGTSYSHLDVLDPKVAVIVANAYLNDVIPAYLRYFKKPVTTANILTAYNCGIGCVVKGRIPPITRKYIQKYEGLTHEK